jgi:hypothetical protein
MLQTYGSPLPSRWSRIAEKGAAYDGYTVERYRGTRTGRFTIPRGLWSVWRFTSVGRRRWSDGFRSRGDRTASHLIISVLLLAKPLQ